MALPTAVVEDSFVMRKGHSFCFFIDVTRQHFSDLGQPVFAEKSEGTAWCIETRV